MSRSVEQFVLPMFAALLACGGAHAALATPAPGASKTAPKIWVLPPTIATRLAVYQTPYYTIHTDLDPDDVREASMRMTHMAEEYRARTRDFSGEVRQRLAVYLFRKEADYRAAGGPDDSEGVFLTDRLMAVAGE